MTTKPEIRKVPYVRSDGGERVATIVPVDVSIDGLDQEQLQVLSHLSSAIDGMTPIYSQQNDARVIPLCRALEDLEGKLEDPGLRQKVADFNTLLTARNSLWGIGGIGFKFPLDRTQIPEGHPVLEYEEVLSGSVKVPSGRNMYPHDMTREECDAVLGREPNWIENTRVVRIDGQLRVLFNEEVFRRELDPVTRAIGSAYFATTNTTLRQYLAAKLTELKSGTKETKELSIQARPKVTGPIDFVLSTGAYSGVDRLKGERGVTLSGLFVTDPSYQPLADRITALMPGLLAKAPWSYRSDKKEPVMFRFANVLNWNGFFECFSPVKGISFDGDPYETGLQAEALNLVFPNIHAAIHQGGEAGFMNGEFLPADAARYRDHDLHMEILLTGAHEMMHGYSITKLKKDDLEKLFEADYVMLEEARADLFSLWSLPHLVQEGIVTPDQAMAGYYSKLRIILSNMGANPVMHAGARQMMFNYFMQDGAIAEIEEEGRNKYAINPEKMHVSVSSMLGKIGDIKADGNLEEFNRMKEQHLSTERQDTFKKRLAGQPVGYGLIMPALERDGTRFTGKLVYPADYRDQPRSLRQFI